MISVSTPIFVLRTEDECNEQQQPLHSLLLFLAIFDRTGNDFSHISIDFYMAFLKVLCCLSLRKLFNVSTSLMRILFIFVKNLKLSSCLPQ